jgi:hypothetical protein
LCMYLQCLHSQDTLLSFREVSSHDWWGNMMQRVERRDHVNLVLFKTINIYKNFWQTKLRKFCDVVTIRNLSSVAV